LLIVDLRVNGELAANNTKAALSCAGVGQKNPGQ